MERQVGRGKSAAGKAGAPLGLPLHCGEVCVPHCHAGLNGSPPNLSRGNNFAAL